MELWENRKDETRQYRRRKPEHTALYQIVASAHEELARVWEDRYQSDYGVLRDEVRNSFERYLECGILAHGCARAHCSQCNHSELIAFSCKRRCLCPSCDAKRAVIFAENLVQNVLLAHPHQHNVFTIPKIIRPYFKFKRELTKHLYHAAWESWKELALALEPEGKPAAVLALHTAGSLLAFHPHIHGLFLAGVVLPDGSFLPLDIPQCKLQELFTKKVLTALVNEGLLPRERADMILSWEHSGFNVFTGDPIPPSDNERLLFSARYLKKCPLSNERLSINESASDSLIEYVAFKDGEKSTRTFTPLQFLAEVQQHIPDAWEQTSRFMGNYSSRSRGTKTTQYDSPLVGPLPEPLKKPSTEWATLMKRVFEINPLLCLHCGAEMRITAFITDGAEIDRLIKNLGLPAQRAPPLLCSSLPQVA